MAELLRMEGITKQFGAVYANKDINLSIEEGEIHTLLGENGAGKSTLMNILIGLYQPTSGTIWLKGKKVKIDSPKTAVKLGIGMVHQHFMLVDAMTVFENIILGTKKDSSIFIKKEERKKEILELSQKYGLEVDLDKQVNEISVGEQQRVEILKALYRDAKLLILDEPTAVLTPDEVDGLFDMMNKLTSEGHTVIFISHKLNEIMKICDRCTVLRQGKLAATVEISEVHNRQELANLMVGHQVELKTERKPPEYTGERLRVEHLTCLNDRGLPAVKDVSFELQGGEILGVCGVDGNGQSELIQCITGLRKPSEGKIMICDTDTTNYTPKQILNLDVAHIPEDRHKHGMVGAMSIEENLILVSYDQKLFSLHKFLNWKWIADHSKKICQLFKVKTPTIKEQAINLSGGNQQKFVVGRELDRTPKLLVAVHPSRGLDIGATKYIQSKIMEQRDRGTAVLMVSTELDELIELSDRIMVMFEGRIMGIVDQKDASRETLGPMMAGLTEEK